MYKKLIKIFIGNNIGKFLTIIFCISLSLTGFLVSDNLVSNIQTLIGNEAKPILGGDIKISNSKELNKQQSEYLGNLEKNNEIILSKKIQTYTTIVDKYKNPSLVSLVFIDNEYPLYGEFRILEKEINNNFYISNNIEDLFVIDNKIEVYGNKYNIGGIIEKIPESGFNFFNDGKKIVLGIGEFEKLKIDELGARITREYLIKINDPNKFETILEGLKDNNLFEGINITDYKKGGNRFVELFGELDKFIKYILIVSFILTILIIFLSVESFYIGNKKSFSVLKILGIQNKKLIFFNIILFVIIFIISLGLSIFLAEVIFLVIRSFELTQSFYIYYLSIIKTTALGIIIFGVSIILPLLKFFSNNPLAGLKENFLQIYSKKEILLESILVIFTSILIYNLIIGNFLNSIFFTIVLFTIIILLSLLIKYLLRFLYNKSIYLKKKNFKIYDAIRSTIKPGNLSILISFAFIISFTSLFFISIISFNFLEKLNIDLKNNNNIYIINLNDKDILNIDEKYKDKSYSIILGRILEINNKTLQDHIGNGGEGGGFTREFNITDNELNDIKILEGKKIKSGEISIDYDFSRSLNIELGDEILFHIYGKKKKLVVANIRESTNNSINPFFYFQVYKEDFISFPKTYFLTTYISSEDIKEFKNNFLKKTGNHISFIEIEEILKEIKSISKKVLIIIQVLFVYIFIFCSISLIISIAFLIPFKRKKSRLYNILGANKDFIKINNLFEYFYLQSISLIFSVTLATSSSYFILSKSDFIEFSFENFLLAFLLLLLIFITLNVLVRFSIRGFSKR